MKHLQLQGGLGTMCSTFEGKVDTLNYKTIRYPGHGKLMRFLMYELVMKEDLQQLEKILTNCKATGRRRFGSCLCGC